ncbi:peroxynitrite isomerase THAP4 isoform X3 [Sagmatias obliquidens]|uniref:peroxynitrite isomerase THAP4 isoform X3 n=1 Tax=Sagmatias obliquidens TaxID=3371155 RepID=UPI000F43E790|nr:THAP domain-containing protein 4 isoform X3 [Lagenorhynchus obliquidens]
MPARGAPAHPRRREPRAAPRQVPGIQGAPRTGPGGRAAGGRAPPSCRTAGAAGLAPTSRSRVAARPPLGAVPPGARRGETRAGARRRRGGPRPEMVICCAAANCSNRQGKGEKRAVSFRRFPLKDSKRLIQWLKAVQRDNWTPTKYSFLCSEHFTKDSFSKRLEDQHRLLKPTAVPSIFHLAEKKRGAGGHGRPRRKDTRKASGGLRAHASDIADGRAAAGSSSSCSSGSLMAKAESRKLTRGASQGRPAARATREAAGLQRARQPPEGHGDDGPASATASGGQGEANTCAVDAGDENATSPDGGLVDRSGISVDDFTPPGSGACKFIGSLHSYSFSSKHARERPAVPREPVDRKRPKRDAEPGCSGSSPGPDKGPAQSPPRAPPTASSSLTATPQKPAQGPSAPPTDVTPKPAAEAVQSEHSDASPMSINEVILSASGACKLIDSLHSYCFSSRQSKSQVCCLQEQVEKKNGELRALRQRVSRSDSQVRELREKLDRLRRLSLPHLSSLLAPGRGCNYHCRGPQNEPCAGAAVLDAGHMAVRPAGSWDLPDPAALPVPGGGAHLARGPAHAELLVQRLPSGHPQAHAQGVWLHPPGARHQQGGLRQRPEHRHRGGGGGRGERAGAVHRVPLHCQDLLRQGAPRGADYPKIQAEFRRQT